jgi:hypothetical protein
MNLQLVVLKAARTDIDIIEAWQNDERPGLGDEFEIELLRCFHRILENPKVCPIVHLNKQVRRATVRRFKYTMSTIQSTRVKLRFGPSFMLIVTQKNGYAELRYVSEARHSRKTAI